MSEKFTMMNQDNPPPTYNEIQAANLPPTNQITNEIHFQPSSPNVTNASQQRQEQSPPVFVQQPVFVRQMLFTDHPQQFICPNCRADILSQLKYESGVATWLIAGGICLLGCWLGCCLIPFCVDGTKDVEHYCPNCRSMIGRYKRI